MYRFLRSLWLRSQLWWLRKRVAAVERRFRLNAVEEEHELRMMEIVRRQEAEIFENDLSRARIRFAHNREILEAKTAHLKAYIDAELKSLHREMVTDENGYYGFAASAPLTNGTVDVISSEVCNCDFNAITPCPAHGMSYKSKDPEQILPSEA